MLVGSADIFVRKIIPTPISILNDKIVAVANSIVFSSTEEENFCRSSYKENTEELSQKVEKATLEKLANETHRDQLQIAEQKTKEVKPEQKKQVAQTETSLNKVN
jgi:hypothetical protein